MKHMIGKKIIDADQNKKSIILTFEDRSQAKIYDDRQSCCEERYITCDDDIKDIVGGEFVSLEVVGTGKGESEYDVHDQMFVKLTSTKATVTFTTHNVHNGYYGGFDLEVETVYL